MDVTVRTGGTKAVSGVATAAFSLQSAQGEHACILLHGEGKDANVRSLKEECQSIMENALLGVEGDAWTRLDGTLKELNGLFKGFLVAGTFDELHAAVALLDTTGTLHISASGRAEGYLVRDGSANQITEVNKGKPLAAFVHISSGQLEPGDSVVIATHRLLRAITPAQLVQMTSEHGDRVNAAIIDALESEKESAALCTMHVAGGSSASVSKDEEPAARADKSAPRSRMALPSRRAPRRGGSGGVMGVLQNMTGRLQPLLDSATRAGSSLGKQGAALLEKTGGLEALQKKGKGFLSDLKDPKRKRKAHFLLLAAALAVFVVVWSGFTFMTSNERSKTKTELAALMTQIDEELRTADNRKLAGDMDGANTILQAAEERARQVLSNETGLYRTEATTLLEKIQAKQEEINNILRVPLGAPLVSLAAKDEAATAQGLINVGDSEFVVYDRQNAYRVILSRLDDAKRLTEDDLILMGTNFDRYKSQVFMTSGNGVVELSGNDVTPMKTDDPNGWITGKDMETYLRYLYVLAPDKKQIYKYERLTNRYTAPVQYNVNGDLTGALDMAIDTSVYVVKEGGVVLKLLRGETQPFAIRHAPEDVLKDVTKLYKVSEGGNFYFLDPVKNRVIVATDGGTTGESSYLRQYIVKGDQLGVLQDLYVDPEESHLYLMDEKRVYVVDLAK